MTKINLLGLSLLMAFVNPDMTRSQSNQANYREDLVPEYELPDPLIRADGIRATNAQQWANRRSEILQLFQEHVFGCLPPARHCHFRLQRQTQFELPHPDLAKPIKVLLREVRVHFDRFDHPPYANLLALLPGDKVADQSHQKVPIFLGYNFEGNHSVLNSDQISLHPVWNREAEFGVPDRQTRGSRSSRWPVHLILAQGFGLVTLHYGDVDPDFDDGFKNGIHGLHPELQQRPDNWSSIGAWAWGLHRVMDWAESNDEIDEKRVALIGHSRLGKTALWAGATDDRFALVISNNSGCGGAALSRRQFGETVERINSVFPHWFCKRHRDYNGRENELPVDHHMLISLMAPRPVYVASATEDLWADPTGEFLSTYHAQPVYELFTQNGGLGIDRPTVPEPDHPIGDSLGYHLRTGKHDMTEWDWQQYLEFAKRHLVED